MKTTRSNPSYFRLNRVTKRKKKPWILIIIVLLVMWLTGVILYQTHKPLPQGISFEGPVHHVAEADIDFLHDLTYLKAGKSVQEQMIFDHIYKAIENAEQFIIIDMFLYNGFHDEGQTFPPLSRTLTDKLIAQKTKHPNMQIIVNTDEINTSYGSHASPEQETCAGQ